MNISEAVVELPKQDVPKKPAEPAKPIVQDGPNEVGPLLEIGKIAETDKIEPAKPSKTIRKRRETPKIRVSEPGTAEIPGKVEKREKTRKNHVFHPGDRAYQLARLYDTDTDTVDIFPMKLATIVSRRKSEREGLPDSYIVILDGEKEQRRIVVDNLATQEEYPD